MFYLVTLERVPVRGMRDFVTAISESADDYQKLMANVWMVQSRLTAGDLFDVLSGHITDADSLLVIGVRRNQYGAHLPRSVLRWMRDLEGG